MSFSDKNITDFISGMIMLGGGNQVTDDDNKMILNMKDENCTLTLDDNTQRNLAVFGTKSPDVIIINPFAEGESNSSRNNWFYHSRNILLACMVAKCVKKVLEAGARAHSKKVKEEKNDKKFIPYLSKYASACDSKTVDEFQRLIKTPTDFFMIYYNKKKRQAEIRSNLFREESKTIYSSIRVATWEALRNILLKILGVKDLAEYNTPSKSCNIPVLESFTNVYLNIFDNMKEILELCDVKNIDTSAIRSHLSMLDAYHQRAKWCMSTLSIVSAEKKKEEAAKEARKSALPPALANTTPWSIPGMPSLPPALTQTPVTPCVPVQGVCAPLPVQQPVSPLAPVPYQVPAMVPQVQPVPPVQPWAPVQPPMAPMQPVAMVPPMVPQVMPQVVPQVMPQMQIAPAIQQAVLPASMMGQGIQANPTPPMMNSMMSQGVVATH